MAFRRSVIVAAALAVVSTARAATPDVTSLAFLLGGWEAIGTPAGEKGGFTFSLGVQNRVMTRTNYAIYDARDGRAASRHDDFMIIYVERGQLRADYFDSEEHVVRYVGELPGDRSVVFVSDVKASDPRYRLTYTARDDGTLAGQFEIAAPGASDAFKLYLSWTARRRP